MEAQPDILRGRRVEVEWVRHVMERGLGLAVVVFAVGRWRGRERVRLSAG